MITSDTKKLTILVGTDMHETLLRKVGRGNIGQFLINAAKPHLEADTSLRTGYAQMAADEVREKEAREWENLGLEVYES
jgi:tartrate dehydratase beta subunit/fumarate hydratase class I family protein